MFHTKFERVWDYVKQFSKWMPFDHRVKGMVPDKDGVKKLVPIPPVQETVNTLFGESVDSDEAMSAWYETERYASPRAKATGRGGHGQGWRGMGSAWCGEGGKGGTWEECVLWAGWHPVGIYEEGWAVTCLFAVPACSIRVKPPSGEPANGEEAALSRVSRVWL